MTITCPDCGSTQIVPLLPPRAVAECHRCDRLLERRGETRFRATLACSAAMLVLLPAAAILPLMHSTIANIFFAESRLVTSVPVIYREVWFPFAFGFLFFALLFPALRAAFLILVLGSIRLRRPFSLRGRLFRWAEELMVWSMTDVVVLAGVVTYFRASIPAQVELEIGAWCYLAVAALSIVSDRALDRRAVWHAILPDTDARGAGVVSCPVCDIAIANRRPGDRCPRCAATLDMALERLIGPSAGALAAAFVLILPAFTFVVMVNERVTGLWEHTILGTVRLLADYGQWHLGGIVLLTGGAIPLAVLFAMVWLLASVRFPRRRGLILRTRVYRVIRRLSRWPMLLPFVVATSAPIVAFQNVDDILAGPGATPFFMLVVLLMLSVRLFEPRVMWKTAGVTR
jgi:paraquat-inducible protein A